MRWLMAALVLLTISATPAIAHSSTRGFVMLLPTGYVIIGGALAVLLSFALVSLLHDSFFDRPTEAGAAPRPAPIAISLAGFAVLGLVLWIGFAGPSDPAENLLPLTIWTLWWIILVLLHAVFGNLWSALNPFTGLHRIIDRLSDGQLTPPPMRFPDGLSYWPALFIFAGFAWFQLVDPAPEAPRRLAVVVAAYAAFTLAMVGLFGPVRWLAKADPFAIFLSQLGAVAPFANGRWRPPGSGLLQLAALPVAGMFFVLLTLSTISFDGFSQTFLWLSVIGVNPLDYPGRTALVGANTLGLFASLLLLALAYVASVMLGWRWAGKPGPVKPLLGRFVLSLIPISIAYHIAHFLGDALLNLQYTALALNDPWGTGANLLGLEHYRVTASFQNTASGALVLFTIQTAAIIVGHIVGVAVAHAMALETGLDRSRVVKLEAPLAAFMVAYTAFGLWLLAAPAIS
jgi:hypothetical protein